MTDRQRKLLRSLVKDQISRSQHALQQMRIGKLNRVETVVQGIKQDIADYKKILAELGGE